jgi:hypothetical protein
MLRSAGPGASAFLAAGKPTPPVLRAGRAHGPHISLLLGLFATSGLYLAVTPATAAMQATAAAVQAFLPATRGAPRPAGRRASTLRLVQQQQRRMVVLRALGGEWLAAEAAARGACLCSRVGRVALLA